MASFKMDLNNLGAKMPMRGSSKSSGLVDLLYSLGMPSMSGQSVHQDNFMRRLNAGEIDVNALGPSQGGAAMGNMGGAMQRPRGGMMGFSPFRINTRYSSRGQ